MTLFEELKEKIHSKTDSNFHLKCLDLTTQVWIQELCELIDEKIVSKVVENKPDKIAGTCIVCGRNGSNYACVACYKKTPKTNIDY